MRSRSIVTGMAFGDHREIVTIGVLHVSVSSVITIAQKTSDWMTSVFRELFMRCFIIS